MTIPCEPFSLGRRHTLERLCAIAAISVAPMHIWAWAQNGGAEQLPASDLKLLNAVCDAVLPRTDTPGALDVGVPQFVALAAQHRLEGAPGLAPLMRWLEGEFKAAGGISAEAVAALDKRAFSADGRTSPWHPLKALILLGYYTSEAGAAQELRYELVPGRFDPDVPLTPAVRNSSSDWIALTFG